MQIDYDQILAKRPHSEDAVFAWHQDMAYWPPFTSDISAATCWLAVSDSTEENGCMRSVAGSQKEPELRKHAPGTDNSKAVTVVLNNTSKGRQHCRGLHACTEMLQCHLHLCGMPFYVCLYILEHWWHMCTKLYIVCQSCMRESTTSLWTDLAYVASKPTGHIV